MPKRILKGYVFSIVIFLTVTMAATLLVKLTPVPEAYSGFYVLAAVCLACLFVGIYSGNVIGKKGLLVGMTSAVLLILMILICVALCFSINPTAGILRYSYLLPIFLGGIGGILGTNIRN